MELIHHTINQAQTEVEVQYQENTNPVQNNNIGTEEQQSSAYPDKISKTGKRPRIQKPLYSAKLFRLKK